MTATLLVPPPPPAPTVVAPAVAPAPRRDRARWAIGLAAALLGVAATALVYALDQHQQLGDEASHILAARRVTDSATPGFAQLGQYWPPLFHVMELPFAWIGPLYRSGLAGAIPSVAAYVVGVLGAYELGRVLTGRRANGVVAAAAFGLNPALLYLAARPMMETTITATLVWSAASLAGFRARGRLRDAVAAGVWVALAMLSHYGAVPLVALGVVLVVVECCRRGFSRPRVELWAVAFALPALAAGLFWLAWGFYIQDDPLYFAHRGLSAVPAAAASVDQSATQLAFADGDPGNLAYSVVAYGGAVLQMLGPVAVAGVAAVLAGASLRRRLSAPVVGAAAAGIFVVGALFLLGGSVGSPLLAWLSDSELPQARNENIRYGMYLLPLWAACAAALAGDRRRRQAAVATVVVAGLAWFAATGLHLARREDEQRAESARAAVAETLRDQYDGTRVLVSGGEGDLVVWRSRLDASSFVGEANAELFDEAVARPRLVGWIVVTPSTVVDDADAVAAGFVLVERATDDPRYSLWRRA